MSDYPYVVEATEEDLQAAVENALRQARMTRAELLAEGRSGRFSSLRARLAWVAVGDVLEASDGP